MDMDKSLDDIIKSKPKNHRRHSARRGGKAAILGNPAANAAKAARQANGNVAVAAAKPVVGAPTEKIIVSNLPLDVNEQQIRELFSSTVGALREVTLHYDQHGKSKGVATVNFSKKGDGLKAHQQYNNRLIDGKRPMKVEMVLGPAPPPTLASRVAPAAGGAAAMEGVENTAARRGTARRRGGGGRRGRGGGKGDRPAKTSAELDTEMEDYSKAETAAAATA